jgi:hypothetical protein
MFMRTRRLSTEIDNFSTNRVRFVDTPHAHVILMWHFHMRRLIPGSKLDLLKGTLDL